MPARRFNEGDIDFEAIDADLAKLVAPKLTLNSPLKKALLTGFHSTAKHNATKAVSPSSETMRTI